MPVAPDVLIAILAMAAISYACRVGGFAAMGFVPLTRATRAWLESIPFAVIGAVVGPALVRGGTAEWAGFAIAVLAERLTGNDFLGVAGGLATVALARLVLA